MASFHLRDFLSTPEGVTPLVRRFDEEIKTLEKMKEFCMKRVEIEKSYACKLASLNDKYNPSRSMGPEDSSISKVWEAMLNLSEQQQAFVEDIHRGRLEEYAGMWLMTVISAKKRAKDEYLSTRARIQEDLNSTDKKCTQSIKSYNDTAKSFESAAESLEKKRAKGGKAAFKAVTKRKECTDSSIQKHNEFVLNLRRTNLTSNLYFKDVLPVALDGVEHVQKLLLRSFQITAEKLADSFDNTTSDHQRAIQDFRSTIAAIDPETEFNEFLGTFRDDPIYTELGPDRAFEPHRALSHDPDNLLRNGAFEREEYMLYYQSENELEQVQGELKDQVGDLEGKLSTLEADKQQSQDEVDTAVLELTEVKNIDDFESRIFAVEKSSMVASYEVEMAETSTEINVLNNLISGLESTFSATQEVQDFHDDEKFESVIGTAGSTDTFDRRRSTNSQETSPMSKRDLPPPPSPGAAPVDRSSKPRGSVSRPLPTPPQQSTKATSADVRDLPYFHGAMDRADTAPFLLQIGDYLVRESRKRQGELALSVRGAEKVTHFIIQQDIPGKFRFEGDALPSVQELVDHYTNEQLPVTKNSGIRLKCPVYKDGSKPDDQMPHDTWRKSHTDVRLGKKLGNGNFGEVFRGTMTDGMEVAVKTCRDNVPDPRRFLEEAEILKDYDHPNIVKLIGVVDRQPVYIILELCMGGDLLAYLRKNVNMISIGVYVRMSSEAADGMAYLHTKHCIHRDLAARNCLVTSDGIVKISDFGMSRMTGGDDDDFYTVNTTAKTIPIKWTAPEALEQMVYTKATDVWAFGILLWEIFSGGKMPYAGMTNADTKDQVINRGYRMAPPPGCPEQVNQLMAECWLHDEKERPTMEDIVDYFNDLKQFYPDETMT